MPEFPEDFSRNLSTNCKSKIEFEINKERSIKALKKDSPELKNQKTYNG